MNQTDKAVKGRLNAFLLRRRLTVLISLTIALVVDVIIYVSYIKKSEDKIGLGPISVKEFAPAEGYWSMHASLLAFVGAIVFCLAYVLIKNLFCKKECD